MVLNALRCSIGLSCVLGFLSTVAWAESNEVSPREYSLYMDWKEGREDPRLQDLSEAEKRVKIAKSLAVSVKILEDAIARVSPVASSLAKETERSIGRVLNSTEIGPRLLEVHVDASHGHVVAGVKWRCGDIRDRETEAATVAWALGQGHGGPVVTILALWCVGEDDTKLFSAKIGRSGFMRIQKRGIQRFSRSRYIRLFEEVRTGPHQG